MAENNPESAEAEVKEPFPTVYVLQAIKNAQQKHGLRHQNYQRYRTYCSDKIKRVRTCLKFTHHHKCTPKYKNPKFQLRPVTEDVIDNARFFEILIFEVERAWAYAMQLKYESNDDELSRKKFHKMNKLRRALEHAVHLEQIAKNHPRVDSTTKLEIQAYCDYIGATYGVEAKQWKTAEELYKKVCAIYGKLIDVVDSQELCDLYSARCKEVQPLLKLCAHFVTENIDESESKKMKMDFEQTQGLNLEFDDLKLGTKDKAAAKKDTSEAMEVDTAEPAELPRLDPMPCKPVFFDLALNHIKMPSLNSRIRELSEKEKPTVKKETSKKESSQKTASSKKEAQSLKQSTMKKNEETQKSEPQEEQASIASKVKNLFWGYK
jgi:hypothetical protein